MRRFLLIVLIVAGACNVWAQKQQPEKLTEVNAPENIASQETRKSFIPPADFNLKSGAVLNSDFQVEFVNFPENAKSAFLYAISIYENLISSPVPIKVQANWETLGTNVLALTKPSSFYKNFDGARLADVYYPVALAEKLAEKEFNGSEADIICTFNKNINWYKGTNGDGPSDEYDLVTVALHEIIHGLGFSGFFNVENGEGNLKNSNGVPSIYDVYIYNSLNQKVADENTFAIPSAALKNQLVSQALLLKSNNEQTKQNIYAPSSWNSGTSIYHYNESGYAKGDANALMSPYIFKGEAIHHPGDKTLALLAEFGWKSLSIEGAEIKDFEETCEKLPVSVQVNSELDIDMSSVKITYSTDKFATSKTETLAFNRTSNQFEGEITLNNQKGKIQYYYEATSTNSIKFTCPDRAPERIYSFSIGPDYYPPVLKHNPEKLVATAHPVLDLNAIATDNVGIEAVTVEFRINGAVKEQVALNKKATDLYGGQVELPFGLTDNDVVEYRILAQDNTARGNKRFAPATGYYTVDVFESQKPLTGYYSNFDSENSDFEISDFEMNKPEGFSSGNLHTINPYPESSIENEKYNLIAQLKYPIILEENGLMTFDEVVLVEPGEKGTTYTEEMFWDFVIVEGSKNNGKSWLPVTEGYDSGVDELWTSYFQNTLKSTVSEANGQENMFLTQTIDLTDNTEFEAGDTVIFRFRLASDKAVTGWGWAIDNLSIQEMTTAANDIEAEAEVAIYPNPFKQSIYVEGFTAEDLSDVEIIVTDLYGKTVFRETRYDASYNRKMKIDLPNVAPGIYMACITDNHSNTITQKIIKN
ncbi:T9SS type A sorting domain-containing protein [Prolixibacteraceae bacterium Z1-6]|uniref:T9SS type A sorting domain-containing protein n=1 Tax=Draconibacterium aestuarii TaxID=2998507 RepID=A0A9X3F659_9BACT|nr:T9SS type A sorting domain-containing protein [Prolixibacteraceae bacterium Z1-6]